MKLTDIGDRPQFVRSRSGSTHASKRRQRAEQQVRNGANATGFYKHLGRIVRDEEVVGSNPATPTRVIAFPSHHSGITDSGRRRLPLRVPGRLSVKSSLR
jgi:hypothetical protein